ncbi:hypothetical protein PtrV1_05309 [Pyrenophora tritici-repentis]|nr:hypothetical protein PtrV1_05309 [Pyrenophora tritici-repentis]KAF7450053.1 hypothetical protein A1F99_046690 [Pyrenophora tritici-repentis]KAI1545546.1 DnaJ domain containing protein [Pyrenophora tritici-repentis]KAI1549032.1 hypothetical protein PtrSN001C_001898 [Pyrenophora tritici-repentis]KAI1565052.1 DnaJ domain containing protein [Pyrenophora tritici-repentis]
MNNTSPQRPSVYDHYATLGLDIFASDETISAAIRSLRKKLNKAEHTLMNKTAKTQYDNTYGATHTAWVI